MPWKGPGKRYYYQSQRIGKRVRQVYIGAGPAAALAQSSDPAFVPPAPASDQSDTAPQSPSDQSDQPVITSDHITAGSAVITSDHTRRVITRSHPDHLVAQAQTGADWSEDLPGILAWAVQGCRDWQANGLQEPPAVKAATSAYQSEMDVIGQFMDEYTAIGSQMQTTCSALYAAYSKWAEESGERAVSQRRFGEQMNERGIERIRTRNGFIYIGVGLIDFSRSDGGIDLSKSTECDPCDPCEPKNGVFPRREITNEIPPKKVHKDHKDHTYLETEDLPDPPEPTFAYRPIPRPPESVNHRLARERQEAEAAEIAARHGTDEDNL